MTALRVASYNTRDFLDDRAAAARIVQAIRPDVLCLQEVPRRLFAAHRIHALALACGMRWPGHHRGSGGTTILLGPRVRLTFSQHHRLPVRLGQRTRGYAVARLAVAGSAAVTVASVHLSLRPLERAAHARAILAAIGSDEAIICGDLNEQADGQAWRLIATPLRLVSPLTPTFPARAPRKLLDVVFASPGIEVVPAQPLELDADDLVAASDHRPVWADLVLPPVPGA
ncbi:endonuclease/exonuclease/phosphatase family protein [Nostocoides vanveenii]|uniref:Endonuclease/exonuclease/phosphatase family protein n=1 Tax=Nostocoides vanveenii TaxID=330835 RepID=A0ABP4W791_9MICO